MKLLDLTCPKCGAQLKIDDKITKGFCEHCGTVVLIDDEVKHIQYDNVEEAGYNFEKGRQRAQVESRQTENKRIVTGTSQANTKPAPKKRKTWLWVLGWIFIFPVPLTIIISKSKLKKPVKIIIISVMWTVIFIIGILNRNSESENESYTTNSTVPKADYQTTSTDTEIDYKALFASEMKDESVYYQDFVFDDVTEEWRLCEVVSSEQVVNHAVTYYRAYFEDDREVHAVVNLGLNTTTKLTVNGVNIIADVYEYVEKEELSAKTLFSGLHYSSYLVNKVTGEIERVDSSISEDVDKEQEYSVGLEELDTGEEYLLDSYTEKCEELCKEYFAPNGISYEVSREDNTIIINIWKDGFAIIATEVIQGLKDRTVWDEFKVDVFAYAYSLTKEMREYGLSDGHIIVNILNDINRDNSLLTFYDEVMIYDCVEQ